MTAEDERARLEARVSRVERVVHDLQVQVDKLSRAVAMLVPEEDGREIRE